MKWYWANWYNVNAGIGVLAFSILGIYWTRFDVVQRCIIANFAVVNLHNWEEFGFPGGFPGIVNTAFMRSDRPPNYPLNQIISAVGNNWLNYFVYLGPVFFPGINWLTLCPIAFGLLELSFHGVVLNILVRRPYNPGLATSLFGFLPIAAIYLRHEYANGLITSNDWLWAFLYGMANYLAAFYYLSTHLPGGKDARYSFTKEEMDRFDTDIWLPSVWLAYYRENWYYFTAAAFVASTFVMGFLGHYLSHIQIILTYNTMALLVHQVEEYILPGGGPLVMNVVIYEEKSDYDRFPGNKQSMVWVNTLAYPFYLSAVVFPQKIWLGLAQCLFGFSQVFAHGLSMNIAANTGYNPGLASALLLHLPIGIYYIAYVQDHGLVAVSDWLQAVGALVATIIVTIPVPILAFCDRNSAYPLTQKEMSGFDMLNKFKAKGLLNLGRETLGD
ncbi:hypothetical protein B0J13DRAFT_162759 [Dactylonectria estremocensis]|uniref:Uncharacterized protein n=1 Tax=Dactylonectria estremocensis TaxID=1079267 RepID=A0A9P9IGZ7_9HYPO|nr:hypothetical protein B0J13DRAFT_162759 [Dactylonectria estremocensis]